MEENLFSKKGIKNFLEKYSIFPSKRLGQNFLIDKFSVKKIIKEANISAKNIVLEIGPGTGNLTQEIAKRAKKIIGVEKDPKMFQILKERFKNFPNVEIILGDIRKMEDKKIKIKNHYKIVANLPFYLTAPIIRKFLEKENHPEEMILVVQKEFAQRICAKPPHMNLLAVSVQFYAQAKIIDYIPKTSFWPKPKVDSAILKIFNINQNPKINRDLFFKIVKAGFSHKRKTLVNNLSKKIKIEKEKIKEIFKKNNIPLNQRPENLTLKDWQKIISYFSTFSTIS